jgi:hypothetical protein
MAGPAFAPQELAARKTAALFDRDEDIPLPVAQVAEVRRFFREWAAELHAGGGRGAASSGGGL